MLCAPLPGESELSCGRRELCRSTVCVHQGPGSAPEPLSSDGEHLADRTARCLPMATAVAHAQQHLRVTDETQLPSKHEPGGRHLEHLGHRRRRHAVCGRSQEEATERLRSELLTWRRDG